MKNIIRFTLILSALSLGAVQAHAGDKKNINDKGEGSGKFEQFDPQAYTCNQFVKDLPNSSEAAGVALIWAHGYTSAMIGTDEAGPLDEKAIGELAKEYTEYCNAHPKETFSRASKTLAEG